MRCVRRSGITPDLLSIIAKGVCAYKTVDVVDEDGLHERLVAGDEEVLAEVYDRFSRSVFGLALRITHDRALAEDVTQETFLALWQSPSTFDPTRGSLRSWLCMVAHRRSVDVVRRNESQKRRSDQLARDGCVDLIDEGPEQRVLEKMSRDRLELAINMLPDEQKHAVVLAYFDGLTFRQVAEALRIPEGTAKSRIRLATKRLARSLRNPDDRQLEEVE